MFIVVGVISHDMIEMWLVEEEEEEDQISALIDSCHIMHSSSLAISCVTSSAMRRALVQSARQYASTSRTAFAQPLQMPSLDASSQMPSPPRPQSAPAASSPSSSTRIAVPTASASSVDAQRQLVTLTLRTRALDIEAPAYGIHKASFPYVWLRDVCTSAESVDPSTRQKHFKTEDIKSDIKPWWVSVDEEAHTLRITWDRPLDNSGKPRHAQDESTYALDFLRAHSDYANWRRFYKMDEIEEYKAWDKASISA